MKPWTKVHPPRWKCAPGLMSCEEIRWWMLELKSRGWTRGVMGRTLGLKRHNWRKALGKEWIYPTEQVRMSRQLRRIISGEIVLRHRVNRFGKPIVLHGTPVYDAVLAYHPEPLRMPMHLRFDMGTGRLSLSPQYQPPENPLPNFKRIWENMRRRPR